MKTWSGDLLSTTVMMSLFSMMETLLGIIAASSPCLKAPTADILRRIGFLSRRHIDVTRPSFVKTSQDHERTPSTGDSGQIKLGHISDVEGDREIAKGMIH